MMGDVTKVALHLRRVAAARDLVQCPERKTAAWKGATRIVVQAADLRAQPVKMMEAIDAHMRA